MAKSKKNSNGYTCFDLLEEVEEPLQPKTFETRDYQDRVINNTLQAIEDGHKTILIEMPPGAGKTAIGGRLAQILSGKYNWKAGWTAMRHHLLIQAARDHHELLNNNDINYYSTFTKAEPSGIDLWIEDEGHHNASLTATTLVSKVNPKVHIGLTATPYRSDSMKLCFSKVIKDASTYALIEQGYLAPYYQYILSKPWHPEYIADCYGKEPSRWGKTVMYFSTIRDCHIARGQLLKYGVGSEVVTSNSDQETQLARFETDDIDVLLNVQMLTEGFDYPGLETVFVRPTKKQGPSVQMAGRVLRKSKNKEHGQIVQNIETSYPFSKVAPHKDRFVETDDGGWVSNKEKDKLRKNALIVSTTAKAKADAKDLPKTIKNRKPSLRRFQK